MKQFNLTTKSVKSLFLLLALLLGGTSPTWADELTVYDGTGSNCYIPVYGSYADTQGTISEFIVPATPLSSIKDKEITKMTFYTQSASSKVFTSTFKVYLKEIEETVYESSAAFGSTDATVVYTGSLDATGSTMVIEFDNNYTYNGGNLLVGIEVIAKTNNYASTYFYGETQSVNTAFYNKTSATRVKFIPKTTFTTKVEGSGFEVKDDATKVTSPYDYNFGLATAGTTKTFTLSNPGTETTPIAVDVTGANGFTATVEGNATSIPAGGEKTLTITMPNATASGSIVVTPTGAGLSPFTFNVSGTVRDPNKVYLDFSDGQMPEGWTQEGYTSTGYYSTTYEWTPSTGYISYSYTSSEGAGKFISPKLNFSNGEQIFFETAKYSSSTWYNPSIKVEYTTDATGATGWTAIGSAFTDDTYGTWTKRSVTIPVDGVKRIRFNGWYIHMRNIYGGELPNEPNMVVTQPTSLDFGVMYPADAPTKTFTIANTGKAALENITVTSSEGVEYAFHLSNVPTSLAAGASQEVTITMGPQAPNTTLNSGHYSTDITVSATGFSGDDAVNFTVEGFVISNNMSKEEFTDGLPTNWTNAGWTFANGEATGTSSSHLLTTPKLICTASDFLVIKAKAADAYSGNYLTVQTSTDNGETFTQLKKIEFPANSNTEYTTYVVDGLTASVNKIRFVGYCVVVDEIMGLNYAPVLTVTTGDPAAAVSTPANYDFGECAADAYVTYNFANAGAGTINITNVTITGEGAAAYSTNWTESVAAPFDLVITRTYDATRTGTQSAVVTVTTSEGDFIINVSGEDKAANAPELAVSTNAIDFGKVTADAVETVTVTNNGTGSMTVDIASDNAAFEVSAAQLTEIGAGESKTFNITFKFGTPYGMKNGNVTVTPTYDATAAQTITVTGKAKDPNIWSEDFAANELPTGWDAGSNWTIADGVAKGAYAYSSTTYLTTPTLTVSGTDDELTFDYAATSNYVSITIQKSKDGGVWETCNTATAIGSLNNGDTGTATITGLEAGDYQFRFKNDDYNLDNFEGFVLNLPDHMASITAYTIPASSSYSITMKEGQSFDATVTVKESRGVAEELTAKLYMGEEVIGTKAGSVAANGTETLTITCTPTVAALEGAEMHIEVEWAGTKMTTENVTRYVDAITYLTLDETSSDAVVAGTYDKVTLKRKFNAGWNTVCLPFTISNVEGFFGAGAKAYEFSGYTDEGALSFSTVSTLTASYPYVVYAPTAITENIELTNITIASNDASAWYTRKTDSSYNAAYFRGTYAPVAAGAWTKNADSDIIYGVTSDGHIKKAGSSASIKGFRAYFDLPAGAAAPSISFEDSTTGIGSIDNGQWTMDNSEVYNLNGQKVQNAQKGLYIVNGRKVVVK